MKFFEMLSRVKTEELYVGEIFEPQSYFADKKGNKTGLIKAATTNEFATVTKNENNDYVSVENGTIYIDGTVEKVKDEKVGDNLCLFDVKPFAEVYQDITGKKAKATVSKRAAISIAKKLNEQRKIELENSVEM